MSIDVKLARKTMFGWSGLAILLVAVFMPYATFLFVFPELRALWELAPMVRIGGAMLLLPTVSLMAISMLFTGVCAVIPVNERFGKASARVMIWLMYLQIPAAILAFVILPLIHSAGMQSLGYTECNQLHGGSGRGARWTTDWLRDPTLCVKGKDRAWVLEQAAAKAVGQSAAPTSNPATNLPSAR